VICPDFFGCSGKLSYAETRRLARAAGNGACSDFAQLGRDGPMVSSIDRVHRCARDWNIFARIALDHAFGDVLCAGAVPVHAMLSFEFGPDADEGNRSICSAAFARELAVRGVQLGKCHSGLSEGVTAVTVAVLADRATRLNSVPREGSIFLSRPIGALKLLYLSELGMPIETNSLAGILAQPQSNGFFEAPWSFVTDVSGHGLLGAVAQAAAAHGLAVDLALSNVHAASSEVLGIPVECLQNPSKSYDLPLTGFDSRAVALATLRETAGPFVGFLETGLEVKPVAIDAIPLGRYAAGDGRINLTWIE